MVLSMFLDIRKKKAEIDEMNRNLESVMERPKNREECR